jgi:hypothetical protein
VAGKPAVVDAPPSDQDFAIGPELFIRWVRVAELKEQDVNAQTMQPVMFDRLTENIRIRGQVESLPYCHQPNGEGPISIISGHHRTRAARAAGLVWIPVIVDTRVMRRSEVVAKQIAHNELNGTPDSDVLAQMIAMIDNVDDLLMTGLDKTKLPTVEPDDTNLQLPHADFDWRMVTLTFLPEQLDDFTQAVRTIESQAVLVGVAPISLFKPFAQAMMDYGRMADIKSMATVVSVLTDIARREIDAAAAAAENPAEDSPSA